MPLTITSYSTRGTIFVVLDGHVKFGENSVYRRSFNLTNGSLIPFGEGSWIDNDAARIA